METHFRFLEKMYDLAPINQIHKPDISVSEKACAIRQNVDPKHFHGANALHGSVLFKLLDDSAFFAANSVVTDFFVLTGTFTTKFLKPVTKGMLLATGKVDQISGRKISTSSEVKDEHGDLVATGTGIFIISNIRLSELDGYRYE